MDSVKPIADNGQEAVTASASDDRVRIFKARKAYDNPDFVHSDDGRTIRLISEYLYPERYLRKHNITGTIVFFGSARVLSEEAFLMKLGDLNDKLASAKAAKQVEIEKQIDKMMSLRPLTDIYTESVKLAEMFSRWSIAREADKNYFVMTGGGPGLMEAANRGAYRAGAPSIGLNISLPFEQQPNQYISPDLNFEFHYFFMRKFWFTSKAKAIIILPGGFGTMDEMMDVLTLVQTRKVINPIPIVLYKKEFWQKAINFDYLVEMGMIEQSDLDIFKFCDTPEEAFKYVTEYLENSEKQQNI
ncbi:MAG: TIGR00730 family Rossman fold protein [bacterium]